MKRFLHPLLALTFALLQCVAPLVHAHIDGQHSGLVPPALTAPHLLGDQLTQADCLIEADESPAIGLAYEFQRTDHPAISQPSGVNAPNALPVIIVKFLPSPPPAGTFFTPYRKSHPQAPPSLG